MTEEEKEAIKSFKEENDNNFSRFEELNDYERYKTRRDKIILELLKRKDRQIEKLKNENKDLLRKLRNRVTEVKKLTKYSLYKDEFAKLNRELEKKDKIIDKMAEAILEDTLNLDTYWCNGCFKTAECPYKEPKDCIKKYFTKQAKEV